TGPPPANRGTLPLPTAPTTPPPSTPTVPPAPDKSPQTIDGATRLPTSRGRSIDAYTAPPTDGEGFIAPPSRFTPPLPPPSLAAGDRIGGYELKKKLGEGGMGAVYLAQQLSLERDV